MKKNYEVLGVLKPSMYWTVRCRVEYKGEQYFLSWTNVDGKFDPKMAYELGRLPANKLISVNGEDIKKELKKKKNNKMEITIKIM